MIVERMKVPTNPSTLHQMIALLKPYLEDAESNLVRVLVPKVAEYDMLVCEFEYESLAAMDASWAEWNATSEAAEFMTKWQELVPRGGSEEIWELVE